MSARRAASLSALLTKASGLLLCLLLGVLLVGAMITTSGSGGGVTCSGCTLNVIPVSDGSNLVDTGLTYHANSGLFPTVGNSLNIGTPSGSRFQNIHISGTLHATVASLDTLTPRSGNIALSSGALLVPNGSLSAPSFSFSSATTTGFYSDGSSILVSVQNGQRALFGTAGLQIASASQFYYGLSSPDLATARNAGAVLEINNGTAGKPGSLVAHHGHFYSALHAGEAMVFGAHVVTIADNGVAAVENAEVLSGARSLYFIDCLDGNGCTLHVGNSGLTPGQTVRIVSISANGTLLVPSVTTGSNIQHLASAFTMGVNDTITLIFARNRSGAQYLLELGRSNN